MKHKSETDYVLRKLTWALTGILTKTDIGDGASRSCLVTLSLANILIELSSLILLHYLLLKLDFMFNLITFKKALKI